MVNITTIQINASLKEKLDKLKVHHRESYNELISRLISNSSPQNYDKESLIETIEVLSNPETMRDIAKALRDYREGKGKTLHQIEREIGI